MVGESGRSRRSKSSAAEDAALARLTERRDELDRAQRERRRREDEALRAYAAAVAAVEAVDSELAAREAELTRDLQRARELAESKRQARQGQQDRALVVLADLGRSAEDLSTLTGLPLKRVRRIIRDGRATATVVADDGAAAHAPIAAPAGADPATDVAEAVPVGASSPSSS